MIDKLNQDGFLGFVIIFTVLATLIISGIFVAVHLPSALPGELIYPIKNISENVKLAAYELSYENRARIFTDLSNARLDEFERLVDKREYSRIAETLDKMILMQKKALDNIERARNRIQNVTISLSKLEESLQNQQNILKKLYYQVSPEVYDVMDKAILETQKNLDKTNNIR